MHFEIPFNERITRRQAKLLWTMAYKRKITNAWFLVLGPLSAIFLGLIWLTQGDFWMGLSFYTVGLYVFFVGVRFFSWYIIHKRKSRLALDEVIQSRQATKNSTSWTFAQDGFGYKDGWLDISLPWTSLHSYKIVGKSLLLFVVGPVNKTFVLDEDEINAGDFKSVVEFVKGRLSANAKGR
jgi:hypothetical protein